MEVFGFYSLIVIILAFFAEYSRKPIIGLFAAILLLLLGLFILADGLQFRTGDITNDITTKTGTYLTNGTYPTNTTYEETTALNEVSTTEGSTTYAYSDTDIPGFPVLSLGIFMILLAIYGMYAYVLDINE